MSKTSQILHNGPYIVCAYTINYVLHRTRRVRNAHSTHEYKWGRILHVQSAHPIRPHIDPASKISHWLRYSNEYRDYRGMRAP